MLPESVNFLKNLVSIYSPSGKESKIASFIKKYVEEKLHPDTSLIDKAGNYVAVFEGYEPSIMLSSHMDTVKGQIKVKENELEIIGRGACDAKSSIACFIQALIKLKELNFRRKLIFVATVEEETTCKGIKYIKETFKELGLKPYFAVFGEPGGFDGITIAYNGRIQADVAFLSSSMHAASKNFKNPVIKMSDLIIKLNKEFDEKFKGITFNPTIIRSNGQFNVIPSKCVAYFDIRYPKNYSADEIIETIVDLLYQEDSNLGLLVEDFIEPYEANKKSILFRSFVRSILKTGFKPRLIRKNGTGEVNIFKNFFNIPMIIYGPGNPYLSHTNSERIKIEDYIKSISVVKNALIEMDKLLNRANSYVLID
jgi:LysW-gamma-L-lysine carboxypeptidase